MLGYVGFGLEDGRAVGIPYMKGPLSSVGR